MAPTRLRSLLWLALGTAASAACEGAPTTLDEKATTHRAALHAAAVMRESGLALAFTAAEGGTVSQVMGSYSATANSMVAPALSAGAPPTSMLRALVGAELTQEMTGLQLPSMLTTEERFEEAGKELGRVMRERLFVDSNFESKANGTATYLLRPEPTCRALVPESDPTAAEPPLDAKCADQLTKVAVRIAVQADGDGARFGVLIGSERLELVAMVIHSDELAMELDLPKAKAASDAIEQSLGQDSPAGSYRRLAGKVRGSLKKVAAQKVTAGWGILQALDVAPASGGSVRMAASNPVFAVTGDGRSKTGSLQLGLGATDITTTWDPQSLGVSNEDLHVAIGGLYGTLSLDETAKQILLTGVGVGQTKVTVRGASIFALDLNAMNMRRFSGKLSASAEGISRLELTPLFDLGLTFDYNAIAADYSSPPPVTIAHETYGIDLRNNGAPSILEEAPGSATFAGGLKVVAGTLTFAAAGAPDQTVVVPAGKCLSTIDTAPPGAHALLGTLTVADCP